MTLSRLRHGLRGQVAGYLLLALPLPLLLKAIFSLWSGDAALLAGAGLGYALFVLAAMLIRRGVQAELAQAERPPRRRRLPWKTLGGLAAGLAAGFTAFAVVGQDLLAALAYAIGAAAGCFMVYGWDGLPAPTPAWRAEPGASEAGEILDRAQQRLDALNAASRQISNREFKHRIAAISQAVGNILGLIEANPADLRRSRKFLNVYLEGAQQVATQYARSEAHASSPEREQKFRTFLVDVENTCHQQYEKLLQHDVLDLDVQIEVLTTRLRREGIS